METFWTVFGGMLGAFAWLGVLVFIGSRAANAYANRYRAQEAASLALGMIYLAASVAAFVAFNIGGAS